MGYGEVELQLRAGASRFPAKVDHASLGLLQRIIRPRLFLLDTNQNWIAQSKKDSQRTFFSSVSIPSGLLK